MRLADHSTSHDPLADFHPAVAGWFNRSFASPTAAQAQAWPSIQAGQHTLVAAPTGSGKTLTAFLAAINALVCEGVASDGVLPDATRVVYVSPLKALSNDIRINLETPLQGIRQALASLGLPDVAIRTAVRTGDTPQAERALARKHPPHILVTTPESLYVLLGSASGRAMLATTQSVIVDEIHAIAGSKRGSHLALSLERLESVCQRRLLRIGLSATQKPIKEVANFLVGLHSPSPRRGEGRGEEPRSPETSHEATPSPDAHRTSRSPQREADGSEDPRSPGTSNEAIPTTDVQRTSPSPRRGEGRSEDPRSPETSNEATPTTDAHRTSPSPRRGEGRGEGPRSRDTANEATTRTCTIIDIGHTRPRDLAISVPPIPLEAVMSNDSWELVYNQVAALAQAHRTTLVFVNTRRMAERAARHLSERLGKDTVAAHHGSLSKELRLDAEQRLKRGELSVLVATASLELGIDIGDIDLVCQLGSPRSIASFLQRAGRSGHSISGTPKARLFPTTRDDLVECAALLDCVRRGELDALIMPPQPLDVLAQQIVAEVACEEWQVDALYTLVRGAWPYRALSRDDFDAVIRMLAEGFTTRQGARAAYIHHDAVNGQLRARRSARLTALMSGGTIPDTADYKVVLEPQAIIVGTVNEDFAVESMAGDIFQLGNASYRIQRVERDRLRVEDARGAPPSIPFWLGEAPGRSNELSFGVSRLREAIEARLDDGGPPIALQWLAETLQVVGEAAQQLVEYLARAKLALGALPTQKTLILERFFDEAGGTQLVIHTPWGSRINRAWGLALRKRFCRQFNVELQAAATEDAIVLSLSTSHSFALEEVAHYLHSNTAEQVLSQALLDAPLFGARWRWNAVTAMALPRFSSGKRVPPPLQRMKSEDLLASVFPDQVACLENIVGEREVPEHPLVRQTMHDCLREAMDTDGWLAVLRAMESGAIDIIARDLAGPSPLAAEVLNAAPYAFLDDAPLEERRTHAVQSRQWNGAEGADDLGRLDPEAIAAVRAEAWPQVRDADEMHEALNVLGFVTAAEVAADDRWPDWLLTLAGSRRATQLSVPVSHGDATVLWTCAEKLPLWHAAHSQAGLNPVIIAPAPYATESWNRDDALLELVRHRLGGLGPVTVATLAQSLAVESTAVDGVLARLQSEGYVMQGRFTADASAPEWCERHLLARIHRYTLGRLRREIEPVSRRELMQFLFDWQHVSADARLSGPEALASILGQLEGYEAAAGAWESEILPARLADYSNSWLDDLCRAGRISWLRLRSGSGSGGGGGPVRGTPIVLLPRRSMAVWTSMALRTDTEAVALSSRAQAVAEALATSGALFFDELMSAARLLRTELEDALGELVAAGRVSADSFAGMRALLLPAAKRDAARHRRMRRFALNGIEDAGRWSLTRMAERPAAPVWIQDALDPPSPSSVQKPAPNDVAQEQGHWVPAVAGMTATKGEAARHVHTQANAQAQAQANAHAHAHAGQACLPDAGASSTPSSQRTPGSSDIPQPHGHGIFAAAEMTTEESHVGSSSGTMQASPVRLFDSGDTEAVEHIARTLLRRYGVVFWKLLEREASWLPPWRELRRVYQRLEARGEIRGGRFVDGLVGEQFALPEAIAPLRAVRRRDNANLLVCLSGSDPLNLVGTVLVGDKVPALASSRVLYRDGVPIAALIGGKVTSLIEPAPADLSSVQHALLRRAMTPIANPSAVR